MSPIFPQTGLVSPQKSLAFQQKSLASCKRAIIFAKKLFVSDNRVLYLRKRALHLRKRTFYFRKRALCPRKITLYLHERAMYLSRYIKESRTSPLLCILCILCIGPTHSYVRNLNLNVKIGLFVLVSIDNRTACSKMCVCMCVKSRFCTSAALIENPKSDNHPIFLTKLTSLRRPHVQAWLSWSERGTVNP